MIESHVILITTLAEYQTEFWAAIGHELLRRGQRVAFISFDDRSSEALESSGFVTFRVEPRDEAPDISTTALDSTIAKFGLANLNFWFSHERFTFDIREDALRRKLLTYLALTDRACRSLQEDGSRVVLVQELGGFLSVIASFFAARRYGIANWFIEPSFFRGRLFFLKDSFAAMRIPELAREDDASPQVREYIAATVASSAIVVPRKDRHQYTTVVRKIVNGRNIRRLVAKLADKYIHGKRQEFGYIGRHVATHARMLLNSLRLKGSYTPLDQVNQPLIYYPLHVPGDMALTLRSPQYLDQLALVDFLARTIPHTHKIAIKEHPAMIGGLDAGRIRALLRHHDNLVLLPPSTNNYRVLRAADLIVSVNSKSGAEAVLLGKSVIVLGDAFYADSPLVQRQDKLSEIPETIVRLIEESRQRSTGHLSVERYFTAVWRQSLPGELYVSEPANVRTFTDTLMQVVSR